ncbi:hypothetical protein A225_4945 [Klebsiella michiganensis E718]|nr:hypothetical protein A225_4945 [Klebsiella michiganensis E718]
MRHDYGPRCEFLRRIIEHQGGHCPCDGAHTTRSPIFHLHQKQIYVIVRVNEKY